MKGKKRKKKKMCILDRCKEVGDRNCGREDVPLVRQGTATVVVRSGRVNGERHARREIDGCTKDCDGDGVRCWRLHVGDTGIGANERNAGPRGDRGIGRKVDGEERACGDTARGGSAQRRERASSDDLAAWDGGAAGADRLVEDGLDLRSRVGEAGGHVHNGEVLDIGHTRGERGAVVLRNLEGTRGGRLNNGDVTGRRHRRLVKLASRIYI